MPTKDDLIQRINEIEEQLRSLKIELQDLHEHEEGNRNQQQSFFQIGDRVKIVNPRFGQESQGTVCKANAETGWVTVQTTKGKIRHQVFNIIPNRDS